MILQASRPLRSMFMQSNRSFATTPTTTSSSSTSTTAPVQNMSYYKRTKVVSENDIIQEEPYTELRFWGVLAGASLVGAWGWTLITGNY